MWLFDFDFERGFEAVFHISAVFGSQCFDFLTKLQWRFLTVFQAEEVFTCGHKRRFHLFLWFSWLSKAITPTPLLG